LNFDGGTDIYYGLNATIVAGSSRVLTNLLIRNIRFQIKIVSLTLKARITEAWLNRPTKTTRAIKREFKNQERSMPAWQTFSMMLQHSTFLFKFNGRIGQIPPNDDKSKFNSTIALSLRNEASAYIFFFNGGKHQ